LFDVDVNREVMMSEFGAPCSENERVFLSRLWFSDNEQPARLHLPSYYDWVKREKTNVFATHSELHVKQLVANGNRVADVVARVGGECMKLAVSFV